MDPITTALALGKFVPDIIGWIKGSDSNSKFVADKIINIAQKVTGASNKDYVESLLENDPAVQLEFQKAIMADRHVFDQLCLDNTKDARKMYENENTIADQIANSIIKINLFIVFCLVGFQVVAVIWLSDQAALLATVSNIIGIVIHALLKERQDVINFFFGSSLGSKLKTKLGLGK